VWAQTPPSESLLPQTTQGWISVADPQRLTDAWNQTQFGRLWNDPLMAAFVAQFKQDLQKQRDRGGMGLGLAWDDLLSVAGGEAASAIIVPREGEVVQVLLVDTRGKAAQRQQLIARVDATLRRQGATTAVQQAGGLPLAVYTQNGRVRAVFFVHNDLLCAADHTATAAWIAAAATGARTEGTLASLAAFQKVRARLESDPETAPTALQWFIQPLGYAEAQRTLRRRNDPAGPQQAPKRDMIDVMKRTGFLGIQGAGGRIALRHGDFDLLHRIAVYAPRPWEKSLNMLATLNVPRLDAAEHAWVSRNLATYLAIAVDPKKAFDGYGPIFDATVGNGQEGEWQDTWDGIREDPFGPQVDIQRDVIRLLTRRSTAITDNKEPFTVDSQRRLIAVEIGNPRANEQTVRQAVFKILEPDETARLRKDLVPGYEIWELRSGSSSALAAGGGERLPALVIDNPAGGQVVAQPPPPQALEPAAMCVAHGQLFYASHVSMLVDTLKAAGSAAKLADDADYRAVQQAIEQQMALRGWKDASFRRFSRSAEEFRADFELARHNRLHESQSLYARMMRGGGPLTDDGKQWFDGQQLPTFEQIRDRNLLRPSGVVGRTETDGSGWFIVSFTLK
jgi:hypothetical protein